MKIKSVKARQIIDSRGQPTLEVSMTSQSGHQAVFGVPAGASTGEHEAPEKRDGGMAYGGMGVSGCVQQIEALSDQIVGQPLGNQAVFDAPLTTNKVTYGSNTTLGLSGVYCKLSALANEQPLWQYLSELTGMQPAFPRLYANLINGGKHAPGLDIQEIMIVPRTTSPKQATEQIHQFRGRLAKSLEQSYGASSLLIGDEGGFVPQGANHADVLAIYRQIIADMGNELDIALDAAASSFYNQDGYNFEGYNLSSSDLRAWYLKNDQNILSIEDPFAEDDLEAHQQLAKEKPSFFIVGDDTTVTSASHIQELAEQHTIGGVIIKPNQVGTISETIDAIQTARHYKIKTIISHRSGETNDDFIVDLAYGTGAFGLKLGAPVRGERVAKFNRLLQIEEEL